MNGIYNRSLWSAILVVILMFMLDGCSPGQSEKVVDTVGPSSDSVVEEHEAEPMVTPQTEIENFIQKFYSDCVFGGKDFERFKGHFSERLLKKLKNDYGAPGSDGYAVWDFRVPDFMDSSDNDRITAITPLDGDWYEVDIVNGPYSGTVCLKAVVADGWVTIEDMKEIKNVKDTGKW